MNYPMLTKWSGVLAVGLTLLGAVPKAQADVKVVSEVTVKGAPAVAKDKLPDKSITTSYYKGDKQRVETGKSITISDLTNGKTYTLDPIKKTFTVFSLADLDKTMGDNPFLQMLKVETQTTVTPGTATKTIAGKNAKQFSYTTNFKMSMEGSDDQTAAIAQMLPTITITGEQWTSDDVKFPLDYQKIAQSNFARNVPPMMAKGMKEMVDKLAAIKGFPLSSVVTVSFILPPNAPATLAANIPKDPIVTTTEVKTISEESLDDSLFVVPTDYKEVKATPSLPPGAGQ
jgi:hypothetical protein